MIDVLAPALAGTLAAVSTALALRGERRRLETALAAESARTEQLLTLLMATQQPQHYYAIEEALAPKPVEWQYDETGLIATPVEGE